MRYFFSMLFLNLSLIGAPKITWQFSGLIGQSHRCSESCSFVLLLRLRPWHNMRPVTGKAFLSSITHVHLKSRWILACGETKQARLVYYGKAGSVGILRQTRFGSRRGTESLRSICGCTILVNSPSMLESWWPLFACEGPQHLWACLHSWTWKLLAGAIKEGFTRRCEMFHSFKCSSSTVRLFLIYL